MHFKTTAIIAMSALTVSAAAGPHNIQRTAAEDYWRDAKNIHSGSKDKAASQVETTTHKAAHKARDAIKDVPAFIPYGARHAERNAEPEARTLHGLKIGVVKRSPEPEARISSGLRIGKNELDASPGQVKPPRSGKSDLFKLNEREASHGQVKSPGPRKSNLFKANERDADPEPRVPGSYGTGPESNIVKEKVGKRDADAKYYVKGKEFEKPYGWFFGAGGARNVRAN